MMFGQMTAGSCWILTGGLGGMGFARRAGVVIVCDGTPEAARRIERVLHNDPATGLMRHAGAGCDAAIAVAKQVGLDLPMAG